MIKIIAALFIALSFSFAHAQVTVPSASSYSAEEVEQIKTTLTNPELVAKVILLIEKQGTQVAARILNKPVIVKVVGPLQATIIDDVPSYVYKAVILEKLTDPQGLGVKGYAWFTEAGLAMTFEPIDATDK